jgi:hypothetical protein
MEHEEAEAAKELQPLVEQLERRERELNRQRRKTAKPKSEK